MIKRRLLTSVAASTVLAGVLMMSGCGGTNTPSVAANINKVEIAEGSSGSFTEAVANDIEFSIIGKDSNGVAVETAGIKISKTSNFSECTVSNPCNVSCTQQAPTKVSQDDLDFATALIPDIPAGDDISPTALAEKIILFGGKIDISEANRKLTNCGMEVTVKLPKVAYATSKFSVDGVEQTFPTSDGHLITSLEKCDVIKIYANGAWVTGFITEDPGCVKDKFVTFRVTGCPSEIFVFALRHYVPGHTSGATGGTGGTGF